MPPTDIPRTYFTTALGTIVLGDSRAVLPGARARSRRAGAADVPLADHCVDLIVTSPPFGLVRKKGYGNADAGEYLDWFRPFAGGFRRALTETGSLVIDIGGAWTAGQPTRSLYHFKLLVMLCEEFGFHLAQELYWWNPARLPTPAEWVTVRRVRVKDAVNCIWWLSPTPWPRADNRRVAQPYSASMRQLLRDGYTAKKRPSGHDISDKFARNNGAAIPPNLIAVAHTESNSRYLRFCKRNGITPHPARFPTEIPEFFVRMLTDPGDLVLDPFAGSCATGEVCERLGRRWMCVEQMPEYLRGASGRFERGDRPSAASPQAFYRIARPGALWNDDPAQPLRKDGGRTRKGPRMKDDLSAEARSATCPPKREARLVRRSAKREGGRRKPEGAKAEG